MRWLVLSLCFWEWLPQPARAGAGGGLQIKSKHQHLKLEDTAARDYLWITGQEMLVVEITGPINAGLFLRALVQEGERLPPIDFTVVRDDEEQGTVRFQVPEESARVAEQPALLGSGEVQVRIEVPSGRHTYRLLVHGPSRGVAVAPFLGVEHMSESTIQATPGGSRTVLAGERATPPKKVAVRSTAASPPKAPEPELLPAVISGESRRNVALFRPLVGDGGHRFGPGTRISASFFGALLLGGTAALASATALGNAGHDEPVQIRAHDLYARSEDTYRAGSVLLGLAGGALVATLVCLWLEEPAPGNGTLGFRF